MTIFSTIPTNRRSMGLWMLALFLALGALSICGNALAQAAERTVTFLDYDMTELSDIALPADIPDGTMLYPKEYIQEHLPDTSLQDGCSWYLYQAAENGQVAYGPVGIPDPAETRPGYEFYDWAALNAEADQLHTVAGDTVFLARYARSGQYLVSFYYQYDDESYSVAAPTTSVVGGLEDTISMAPPQLESLDGLTPEIRCLYEDETAPGVSAAVDAAKKLNEMLQSGTPTTLDEEFLELCRTAWFVEWDTETDNYKTDENGVVRINIPVFYAFDGKTSFTVQYYQQTANNPEEYTKIATETVGEVTTTHVNLEELGLVKEYDGFTLDPISQQYAVSYTVSPNGSTVIDLHYDREVYYITYALKGGNLREPEAFRYGQNLLTGEDSSLLADPVRPGYTFTGWTYKYSDGTELQTLPDTMPASDLVLEATWEPAQTTVTIVYWLENANDEEYTPTKTLTLQDIRTESSIEYDQIKDNLSVDGMKAAGISDGQYFTLITEGDKAIQSVTAAGDGSTTINAYYDRKEYTLVFHVGWIGDGTNTTTQGWYYISTGGNSTAANDHQDWVSGYFETPSKRKAGAKNVTLTMNGKEYSISNDTEACYQITAKYGAYIGDQWPVANDTTIPDEVSVETETYQLFTWGTHAASPYFKDRVESNGNKNIMGVYSTMSAELIIDPDDTTVAHHLTAYWAKVTGTDSGSDSNGEYKIHHYLFEAVPGAVENGTNLVNGTAYGTTSITAADPSGAEAIASIEFYEYQQLQVRTTHTSAGQNPPAFANLTFQYGCYQGEHVYFFYTYNDYILTYHENNQDLTQPDSTANTDEVIFHYVGGQPLRDTLAKPFNYDYAPEPAYICQYGNEHLFAGWYKDPACTVPIDWEKLASESSITAYAKWDPPAFDLTLEVPGGTLPEDILNEGYTMECTQVDGDSTYVIQNIPDGTPINQILNPSQQPTSSYALDFQDWYETREDGLARRFPFDDAQVMNGNRTLTARWVEQDTGAYTIHYLTETNPGNDLGTVEVGNKEYYRLQEDKTISGLAVGNTVTLEPQVISGYLPIQGSLTAVITGTAGSPTVFAFVYEPIGDQSVTYTVHYVLDSGTDYGRTAPDSTSILLSDSATYTLSPAVTYQEKATINAAASSTVTGTVRAMAVPIPGYVVRDGYQAKLTLCSNEDQNHLYFYYVSNSDADEKLGLTINKLDSISCTVRYFIWNDDSYQEDSRAEEIIDVPAGTVLYAEDYANQYLEETGASLYWDSTYGQSSLLILDTTTDPSPEYILPIYLRKDKPKTAPDWNQPSGELPTDDPSYTPTLPPVPTPDAPESGNDGNGDDDTGSNTGGNTGGSTPVQYTLCYESNGGTVYPTEQYAANTVVPLDKVPLRAGCRFTGWYADPALTQPISTVTMTANCTVYAGWAPSTVPELLNGTDHMAYVIGFPDGTVRPLANVTRAEVAVIFFRLLDPEVRTAALTREEPFTDVAEGAWYQSAVATLHALGIFQGRTDTVFDGGAAITRAEFAAVCARFDRSGITGSNSFTDLDGHWAQEEIGCAAALGWILGYEDGTFRPERPITRAESMSMINRVLHRLPETAEDLLADMTVWPDNPPQAWYYLAVQEATNSHAYQAKDVLYETWTQRLEDPDWTQYQ